MICCVFLLILGIHQNKLIIMKNLKKLNRQNLRSISGGITDNCVVDSDCGPKGCAVCTDLRGRRVCLYLNNYDPSNPNSCLITEG